MAYHRMPLAELPCYDRQKIMMLESIDYYGQRATFAGPHRVGAKVSMMDLTVLGYDGWLSAIDYATGRVRVTHSLND